MKKHNQPGRGLKHCPKCNHYIGVRNFKCDCGYAFNGQSHPAPLKSKPSPTVHDGPGKGRKLCSGCDNYVAARLLECSCGHAFRIGEKVVAPVERHPDEEEAIQWAMNVGKRRMDMIVLTPSGKCPATLRGSTEDDVWDWAEFVLASGRKDSKLYAPSAFRSFLKQFHDVNGDNYQEAKKQLEKWVHRHTWREVDTNTVVNEHSGVSQNVD